ncbi:ketopantoate reductase family protein [Pseudoxanthomonas winnipegensis]|uniref:2-dehydropantoate 2-reductase n=1 Tax=Pseudoxanthomonas winnipegensis TaxID=2480810 RepID=A0A4Q8L9Z8_9GAMM|nr:2-dehydropantoate 2-reductase [Pseudoxanthomonas winnipegensis]RZZ81653.1 2-dehydropantoate 2-reductase [Pseudoxanthomonas winnipegensis]TAA24766.1 2-dehydropantoate 2-reductase [Pseudoxanthomonas winnipegensis]TAA40018.1 2-dehydropantoate 2-reductase [Pseudoxanthomonas winnipegensis]TBV74646.1 2-dehydropantoate 2-reductase [Pseudoxanthomonas winnipegensis]
MRIAVMGAGAVGCYYGAMLARAGHAVTLIGRAPLVEAVQAHGLRLESAAFDGVVALQASTDAAAAAEAELVLCCVKSGDTETAGAALAPWLAPQAQVLSLQNGVDNAARLAQALRHPVIPTVVYVGTEMAGPAHVRHHGRGELVIGAGATSAALAAMLTEAGIPSEVSDHVAEALWAKLVINCCYNALSAISQQPYGLLVQAPGIKDTMRAVFDECTAVAAAASITLPDDLWDATYGLARNMAGQRSSTAQDLARGRPSEIDHLNGAVVRLGREHGIATPVNHTLWSLVKLLEAAPR